MRIRSPYHIHFADAGLLSFELRLWIGNVTGQPKYLFEVPPIEGEVSIDIADIIKSEISKTGETLTNVRYRCDAEIDFNGLIVDKTWQKQYLADFGYNKFEDGPQFDSELLKTVNFSGFTFPQGAILNNTSPNPYNENLATKVVSNAKKLALDYIERVDNDGGDLFTDEQTIINRLNLLSCKKIVFERTSLPTGEINFSNFYKFEEAGTYRINIEFSPTSFIEFDLFVSQFASNSITVNNFDNANIQNLNIGFPEWNFIQAFGNTDGSIKVTIEANEITMYSPSVQRYFDAQGLDTALQQTNQSFFWKKGNQIKFSVRLNSFVSLVPNNPITWNFKDETSEAIIVPTLFYTQPNTKEVENVTINIFGGNNIVIPVQYIPCTKQPITKVDFVNRFGIRQSLFFYGSNKESINTNSESYKSNILQNGSYNVNNHQIKEFNKQAEKTIVLNSGFYNESFNPVFEELFLSERIWIDDIPAKVESSTFSQLNKLNDDLINYEITFRYANDYISNVR